MGVVQGLGVTTRRRKRVSQPAFARYPNISQSTVEKAGMEVAGRFDHLEHCPSGANSYSVQAPSLVTDVGHV